MVRTNDKTLLTVITNDPSVSGLSFISFIPIETAGMLYLEICTPFGTISAKGAIAQQREVVAGHCYFIGVKFFDISKDSDTVLFHLTGA